MSLADQIVEKVDAISPETAAIQGEMVGGFFQKLFKYSMARTLAAVAVGLAGIVAIGTVIHPVPGAEIIIPSFTGFAAAVMGAADWSDTKRPTPSASVVQSGVHDAP